MGIFQVRVELQMRTTQGPALIRLSQKLTTKASIVLAGFLLRGHDGTAGRLKDLLDTFAGLGRVLHVRKGTWKNDRP